METRRSLGRRFGKQKRDSGLLILKKLIEKPLYPRDLTRQGFSRNTVNYHLSYYVKYKIAKKLKDGRYAFIDYADGEEAVAEVVEKWKSIVFRSPTPREIADETGLNLEVARDIAYKTRAKIGWSMPNKAIVGHQRARLYEDLICAA